MQVLRGDGAQEPYRGRIFLGADGVPVTFQARPPVSMRVLKTVDVSLNPTVTCLSRLSCRLWMVGWKELHETCYL